MPTVSNRVIVVIKEANGFKSSNPTNGTEQVLKKIHLLLKDR